MPSSLARRRPTLALPILCLLLAGSPVVSPPPARATQQVWTGGAPRAKGIEAIAGDPITPTRMWAATFGAGVARSLDGGVTWTTYRTGLTNTFVRCLAVQPNHPDSVFCGTNDGVFLSVDGGVNWNQLLSTTRSVLAIVIRPVRTGVVYAATSGTGIYKTINGGTIWSPINLGLVNTTVRDVATDPAKPETLLAATSTGGGVHRSLNGGLTWTQVADTTANNGAVVQIQFDALDPSLVYAVTLDRGVIKSSDRGVTWVSINRGLSNFRTRSLAVVDTLRYVGTDGSGVFFTTLNDPLWHPVSSGLGVPVVDALFASASAPNTCWAGTDGGGIFRTTNRGASWSPLDGGLLNTFGFSLAVRPGAGTLYDGTGFGDQVWRSTDLGATWTRARFLLSHSSEHGLVPDPMLPQRVYLTAYGSGVYRSDDDGVTWYDPDSLNLTLDNHFVRDLVAWPGQSGHLFVGSGIGVWETVDGGAHWVDRSGGLPASFSVRSLALVPRAPRTLYAGSDIAGVWKSSDGGANWSAASTGIPTNFIHALLVDASALRTVYAGTDSGVFKTVNGGASWNPTRTGLPYGALGGVRALVQDPLRPQVLFAGLFGSGVFESLDGGAHWTPVFAQAGLANLNVRSLAVDGQRVTLYAGTDAGVWALSSYLTTVGVESPPPAGGDALSLAVWPNPAPGRALQVRYSLPAAGPVEVTVFDLTGARVRTLESTVVAAPGTRVLTWDARDDGGRPVRSGLFFVRLRTRAGQRTMRVSLIGR